MSAHTPGPWTWEPVAPMSWLRGAGDTMDVMHMDSDSSDCPNDADRALIAAAPDLLAIAKRVAEHFAETDALLGIDARAAIARAES